MSANEFAPPAPSQGERANLRLIKWFAAAFLCIAIGGVILIWQTVSRNASRTLGCIENVKQIVLAMHAYHDAQGTFPPPYFLDRTGRPIHSWRVLLLPYLGEQSLYKEYRFDEPWDGPHNRELAAQMPAVFRCPSDEAKGNETSYMVVIGEGTVFSGKYPHRISDVQDGPANTILFVETRDSAVPWIEPRDLTYEQALAGINPHASVGIASRHGNFAMVATVDGSIWALPESVSRDTLRRLLLCNDGEVVPDFGRPTVSAVETPKMPAGPTEGAVYK